MAQINRATSLFPAELTAGPQLVLRSAQTPRASHSLMGELKPPRPQDLGSSCRAAQSHWHSCCLLRVRLKELHLPVLETIVPFQCPLPPSFPTGSTFPQFPLCLHEPHSPQPRLSKMGSQQMPAAASQEPPALRPSQTPRARPCLSPQGPAGWQTNRFGLPTGRCQLMKLPHFT